MIIYSGQTDRINAPRHLQNASNLLAWQGGNLETVLETVPFIHDVLGCSALHLSCPFAPVPPRWDRWSGLTTHAAHGFWPRDFRTFNPALGGESEIRAFNTAARAAGVDVITEMTFHFGPGATFDPGWETPRSKWCMGTLPRLNLDNEEAWDYVLATFDLFSRLGFRGVRLDTAFELCQHFPGKLEQIIEVGARLGLRMFGEVFKGEPEFLLQLPAHHDLFWTDYPFSYKLFEAIAGGGSLRDLHDVLSHPYRTRQNLQTFVDNHDVDSFVLEAARRSPRGFQHGIDTARQRMLMALTIMFSVPGVPSVYYLDPWCLNTPGMAVPLGINKMPAPWDEKPILARAIGKLARIRKARPELSHGEYLELWLPDAHNVLAFAMIHGPAVTVIIINNEDHEVTLRELAGGGIATQGLLREGRHVCALRPRKQFLVDSDGLINGRLGPRSVYIL